MPRRCPARSPSQSRPAQLGSMLDERKIAIEPDFLVEHIDNEAKDAGLLRRAGDPVRPARDRAAEHGRRLHCPLRARRRAELRAGGQAHAAVQGARQHLRHRRREQHPGVQGRARSRTSPSRPSPATSCQHIAGQPMTGSFDGHANCFVESGDGKGAADRLQLRHRAADRQLPGARGRSVRACCRRAGRTTGASSRSGGCTGTCCCPAARSRFRRTCRWPGSTSPQGRKRGSHDYDHDRDHPSSRGRRGIPDRATTNGTRTSPGSSPRRSGSS